MMKCLAKITNKKGAILVDTLVGLAIYAIIIVAFAATLVTASTLFLKAQVGAREWERVFVKMENRDYSETYTDSPEFNMVLKAADMQYEDIILPDDSKFSTTGEISLSGIPSVTLAEHQFFRRYEEEVEHYATSNSDDTVYVYIITNNK